MASAGPNPGPSASSVPVSHPFDAYSVDPNDRDQQPLSPWAKRFGRQEKVVYSTDRIRHSGLAPEYPRLDPLYYGDNPNPHETFKGFARGIDEDRLFWSEGYQQLMTCIQSWQTTTLNNFLYFSPTFPKVPGGHVSGDMATSLNDEEDPASLLNMARRMTGVAYVKKDAAFSGIYETERIKVDESTWFNFFKRSRWWDPKVPRDLELDLQWSVDDPQVWAVLGIVLELANRMLKALVDDKHDWLRTILFGRLDYWRRFHPSAPTHDSRVLLSEEVDKVWCQVQGRPSGFNTRLQLMDWRQRLEEILVNLKWTFMDNPDAQVMGATDPSNEGIIAIDINHLKYVCGFKTTLAEKCLIIVLMTVTVLHELMHHITYARMKSDSPLQNNFLTPSLDPSPSLEPFVDFGGAAEIGHAFEAAVLGGSVDHVLTLKLPLAAYATVWPWSRVDPYPRYQDHPVFNETYEIRMWRIPASWASKVLSQSFWDDKTVPRKSDDRFHLTPIFVSSTRNAFPKPFFWDDVEVDRNVVNSISDIERDLINDWDNRTAQWDLHRRDWYMKALERWNETPWSAITGRTTIGNFALAFGKRDEVDCLLVASAAINRLPWRSDPGTFFQRLPPHDESFWVFSAIGLLMLAACPIRKQTIEKDESFTIKLMRAPIKPSQRAYADAKARGTINLPPSARRNPAVKIPPNQLGNHFRGTVKKEPNATQFDYIEMVMDLVDYFMRQSLVVSGPWLHEIIRCCEVLRKEREALKKEYPTSYTTKWAKAWPFEMPEYSSPHVINPPLHSVMWVQWNAQAKEWVHVEDKKWADLVKKLEIQTELGRVLPSGS